VGGLRLRALALLWFGILVGLVGGGWGVGGWVVGGVLVRKGREGM